MFPLGMKSVYFWTFSTDLLNDSVTDIIEKPLSLINPAVDLESTVDIDPSHALGHLLTYIIVLRRP